jgi:predicted ATP-dependent Lon-type protease
MAVRKSGRTTGFTTGEITVIEATVTVCYGSGKDAVFENQLIMGPMSQGGDSGSLIVAAGSLQAVGLLFAGSEQSTIANPIQAVLNCLDVTL